MDGSGFVRTVAAALGETRSKFGLAEALAVEIPPRRPGPSGDDSVRDELARARQAILDAGGEPRDVGTLDCYRRTALWVSGDVPRNFSWIAGVSFSAHDEARKAGMTFDEFMALPSKTTRTVRQAVGRTSPDGPKIIESWTPAEKQEAARRLLADEETLDAVAADSRITCSISRARQKIHEDYEQHRQDNDPVHRKLTERADRLRVLEVLARFRRSLRDAADEVHPETLDDDARELVLTQARDARAALDLFIAAVDSTNGWDEALVALSQGLDQ